MQKGLEAHKTRDIVVHNALHDPFDQKALPVDIHDILFTRLL